MRNIELFFILAIATISYSKIFQVFLLRLQLLTKELGTSAFYGLGRSSAALTAMITFLVTIVIFGICGF